MAEKKRVFKAHFECKYYVLSKMSKLYHANFTLLKIHNTQIS